MKHWLKAFRLRTLPLAFSCIGMGGILAMVDGVFDLPIFLLCLGTTISLQILSNLANDYGDTIHGADSENRVGPSRTVQEGHISLPQMKIAIIIAAVISLALGLYLVFNSGLSYTVIAMFITLGVACIIAAVLYTNGRIPYGYMGLGDISVFIFFGLIGVLGTYYLQAKSLSWSVVLPAVSCGLLTVAVLNVNNIRDINSDKLAGKLSIPVRLGRQKAGFYHLLLLVIAFLCASIYVYSHEVGTQQLALLLVLPLLFINAKAILIKPQDQLDPYLKQMALTNVAFVIVFGVSIL
ncbi:1,4-dihydroxy-2-naphthoate polyprenyltransferase [Saprospiraceae bacterium]|nr:1,4-dihydroxy-2-naphthoate polyprenyltransferase [Saprospiraceae bacterium]